ncbi:MAG: alpha/beta hydrolase [Ignavibacteria bacterium]|nr:alpha/beta hydrolase [Ignavibacteria bacterium]
MKKHILVSLTLLVLVSTELFSQPQLIGVWEGSIQIMGQELTILVNFGDDTTATIDIPQQSALGLKLVNVRYTHPRIHFELPAGPGLATFDGTVAQNVIKGDFKQAGATGTFELKPKALVKPQSLEEVPPSLRPLVGKWNGDIDIMGQALGVIVEFRSIANELKATIDIPVQNAKGLNLKNVRFESPKVHFELQGGPGLAIFEGELKQDSINGSFLQAGVSGSFHLARGELVKKEIAPEEPVPYKQEEVVFYNDTLKFAGTLTLPPKAGRHPAVVMITGSGPQNRDEELFGFKPFRMIADHLTRNGIGVLRYDDRGVGGSTGNTMQSSTSDFANDVVAAVRFLRSRPDINPKQIGLCGHSEGGIVAPLAATRHKDIAFVILISGTGVDGMSILLAQAELIARASEKPEADIREDMELNRRIYSAIREGRNLDQFREEINKVGRKQLDQMKPEERKAITNPDEYLQTQINAQLKYIQSPWFRYFISYDPAPTLERVQCPVLALFGELDLQVPAETNKQAMEKALTKGYNKDYQIKVLPKANHLYLTAKTGSPSEYATLRKEFVPGFLDTISDWILKHATVIK